MRIVALSSLLLAGFIVPASSQVNFFAPVALEDQSTPFQVLQGNFYGAGHLDLVAIDASSVNLYRNDGHGHFGAPKSLATSPSGNFFFAGVAGDFNKDGKPDIAVLEYPNQTTSGFFLLLNNGDGTFQMTATVAQKNGQIILAGDFNGDGKLTLPPSEAPSRSFPATVPETSAWECPLFCLRFPLVPSPPISMAITN